MHPIGKAIFVFAGGTSHSFGEFCRECAQPAAPTAPTPCAGILKAPEATPATCDAKAPADTDEARAKADREAFAAAKGPDFLSRLRGYVDIIGPNPAGADDVFYLVRRAMVLRGLLESKAPGIFDSNARANLDDGVLRAFLRVPYYKHANRSMEALLDMSSLAGARSFEQASLPPFDQLRLHVDAAMFSRLVVRDVLLNSAREPLGEVIHEEYRINQKDIKPADDPSMKPWAELDEGLKESNRQQADDLPAKLRAVGCGYRPITTAPPQPFEFTKEEIETMAELEHDRWVTERHLDGWSYDKVRDVSRKTNPSLVPWDELDDEVQEWDRQAVRVIPDLFRQAGFEVFRLE
jgi:hypothetical protein